MEYDNETFYLAVQRSDLDDVRNHLAAGLDPMAKNPWGSVNVLDLAITELTKAEQLEETQENVDRAETAAAIFQETLKVLPKEKRYNALMFYAANSHAPRLARLASKSELQKLANSASVVFTVASNGYDNTLKLLIEHGAEVNSNIGGKPLLVCAAYAPGVWFGQRRANCVKLLLEAGADPNAQDKNGNSALFFTQDDQVAHELIQAGANIKHLNKDGQGLLAGQTENNPSRVECTAYLIEAGAGFEGLDVNNLRVKTEVEKVVAAAWKKHNLEALAGVSPSPNPRPTRPAF